MRGRARIGDMRRGRVLGWGRKAGDEAEELARMDAAEIWDEGDGRARMIGRDLGWGLKSEDEI
jgi:hypothetical protein